MIKQKFFFLLLGLTAFNAALHASNPLWVGQSTTCDASSAVTGITANISWSSDGMLSLSGTGLYRTVTCTRYFGGTASVTCSWQYKLYSNDKYKSMHKTWTFTCNDNPVSLSPSTVELSVGQNYQLSYGLKYSNSYSSSASFNFISTDSSVAEVNPAGQITAKGVGSAYINITSTASSNSPCCLVTVIQVDPKAITLSPDPLEVNIGIPKKLQATMTPANASSYLTWKSSDESIATVGSDGTVNGIAEGRASVMVKTSNGLGATASIIVKPQPTGVKIPQDLSIYTGYSVYITPSLVPEDSHTLYTWSSSDPSVASVNSSGLITGVKEGQSTISVRTLNGLTAETVVTVKKPESHLSAYRLKAKVNSIKRFVDTSISKIK